MHAEHLLPMHVKPESVSHWEIDHGARASVFFLVLNNVVIVNMCIALKCTDFSWL